MATLQDVRKLIRAWDQNVQFCGEAPGVGEEFQTLCREVGEAIVAEAGRPTDPLASRPGDDTVLGPGAETKFRDLARWTVAKDPTFVSAQKWTETPAR
ncbi:MAG TPA: hypothetical protein VJL32_01770 [Candidatus Paceibacterota bacterium]